MLEAHGRDDPITVETMRRVVELDRGLGWELRVEAAPRVLNPA
jgi:hypothetical protein